MAKSVFDRLNQLFNNSIIVRRKSGTGFLRVLDPNRLQALANLKTNVAPGLYKRFLVSYFDVSPNKKYAVGFQVPKQALYSEYEYMDSDPLIATALNLIASGCITKDEYGRMLTIECEDNRNKKILENLYFDVLDVKSNLWPWIRNMLKYGDYFLHLHILDQVGVIKVEPISPYNLELVEDYNEKENKKEIKYSILGYGSGINTFMNEYEIAHFRLRTDTNYDPQGRSILESARRDFRKLQLMEEAMLVHRIVRAPQKRIFGVYTGNLPPDEIEMFVNDIANQIKRVPLIDEETGNYNMLYNMMTMNEDFFIPVDDENKKSVDISTLDGMSYDMIEDIEYVKNKVVAALGVPKAFLGYDQPYGSKSTLAIEDLRFSKTIEQIQQIVETVLKKIGVIHLIAQGVDVSDAMDFDIILTPPSAAYEREKIEILKEKADLSDRLLEKNIFSRKFIYMKIFNMSVEDINECYNDMLEDAKMTFRMEKIKSTGEDPMVVKSDLEKNENNMGDENMMNNMGRGGPGSFDLGAELMDNNANPENANNQEINIPPTENTPPDNKSSDIPLLNK